MTPVLMRTVQRGDDRAGVPLARSERRQLRRERRRVVGTGIVVLCILVCVVVLVLDHLYQGRAAPNGGTFHSTHTEVHVTDRAA